MLLAPPWLFVYAMPASTTPYNVTELCACALTEPIDTKPSTTVFLIMTILCFYQYVCEDHDAIDDRRADERPIRGL
jgi:hypothetical protein